MPLAAGMAGNFTETVGFMREEREYMEAKMEKQIREQRQEIIQMEAKMEAKMEQQQKAIEVHLTLELQLASMTVASAKSCVSEAQLEALQARLDAFQKAELLSDDEIGALEDCIADYIDCRSSLNPAAAEIGVAAEKVKKMVGLSEGMVKDGMLARQLRRKFL
jgi:hypothetical protein